MKNYKEQYLNPQWQKKRLEILKRANWKCELCGDKDSTLHVHHKVYISGNNVWDYPDNYLVCLCESCHESEGTYLKEYVPAIVKLLKLNFYGESLEPIFWGLENIEDESNCHCIANAVSSVLMYKESQIFIELINGINQFGKNDFVPNIIEQMKKQLIKLEKENNHVKK
jgi:hypothetical protein